MENNLNKTWKNIKKYYMLYIFLIPALTYIIIFKYMPMYGIQIAFRNFKPCTGIWGSEWVGFKHFKDFFESYRFLTLLKNTLVLSIYSLIASFPMPIILALIINYCPVKKLKKFTQTATYAPYFISTVVMVSMIIMVLSPSTGIINTIIKAFGKEPLFFMGDGKFFPHIYVWSGIWQGTGWASIIYIAALSGVSPEHHEAAIIDGANKLQRIWYVDIPVIMPIAIILLVLNMGSLLNVGFEKVLLMQNDLILDVAEIISTYTYKVGLINYQYSYSTAIGLFNNVVNFICLIVINRAAKKISGSSLW